MNFVVPDKTDVKSLKSFFFSDPEKGLPAYSLKAKTKALKGMFDRVK